MTRFHVIFSATLLILLTASSTSIAQESTNSRKVNALNAEGRRYHNDIINAIDQADRIVVTEHSNKYDAARVKNIDALPNDEIVYGTRELSPAERAHFRTAINVIDPAKQIAIRSCIIEAHHSIRFYRQQQLMSMMRICFKCDQIIWPGSRATPPAALFQGLTGFIKEVGFTPERDWRALAEAQLERSRKLTGD